MTGRMLQLTRENPWPVFAAVAVAFALALSVLYWQTRNPRVTDVSVVIPDLPPALEGLTILQLTDLHGAWFGREQEKLIQMVAGHRVDLVALTGDLIDEDRGDGAAAMALVRSLQRARPEPPIISVPGNHDWWSGRYLMLRKELIAAGVRVLENEALAIPIQGERVWVLGVDDPYTGRAELAQAQRGVTEPGLRLLLAHSPDILPAAVAGGADLVLVGHTHGGQIRLPFVGAVWAPGQGLFPRYAAGLYREGKTRLYVNRGLGVTGLPFRFLSPPEVAFITIRRGS